MVQRIKDEKGYNMKKIIGMNLLLVLFIASAAFADVNICSKYDDGCWFNNGYGATNTYGYPRYSDGSLMKKSGTAMWPSGYDTLIIQGYYMLNGVNIVHAIHHLAYTCIINTISQGTIEYAISYKDCHVLDYGTPTDDDKVYEAMSCIGGSTYNEICHAMGIGDSIIQYRTNGTLKFRGFMYFINGNVMGDCYDTRGISIIKTVNDASKCR